MGSVPAVTPASTSMTLRLPTTGAVNVKVWPAGILMPGMLPAVGSGAGAAEAGLGTVAEHAIFTWRAVGKVRTSVAHPDLVAGVGPGADVTVLAGGGRSADVLAIELAAG